jgi:hypothetical protein
MLVLYSLIRAEEQPAVEKLKTVTASLTNDLLAFKRNQAVVAKQIEDAKQQKSEFTDKLVSILCNQGEQRVPHQ